MELDEVAYDMYWRPVDKDQILPRIKDFMDQKDWIIDGNYDYLMQTERLEMADRIIFIFLPRMHCLFRALRRSKERQAAGYHNDINLNFLRFLLFECRNKKRRALYDSIAAKYPDKIYVLRSQKQIDRFFMQELI